MNTRRLRSTLIGTLGVALALASGSASAISFRLTDLGTLGESSTVGVAMNASGQVTGVSGVGSGSRAFLWDGTTLLDLGILGGSRFNSSSGVAINDSGQVTGGSHTANGAPHAFLWDGTALLDLGTLGGTNSSARASVGRAINESGQVAGVSDTTDVQFEARHAFLWDGTRMQDLGTLGGTHSLASAINDAGQVTGDSITADGALHAFLWDGTRMQDLGTLGGDQSSAFAINDSGQVTGFALRANGFAHAFLWDGTRMVDLGTLTGTRSRGTAINASGQVTGSAAISTRRDHAFLWDGTTMLDLGTVEGAGSSHGNAINASGQVTGTTATVNGLALFHAFLWDGTMMLDLNALIDPGDTLQPFVTLVNGVDINDRGQILVNGFDSRFGRRVYVLTPVSVTESGTLALLGLGLLGVGMTRRRKANCASHSTPQRDSYDVPDLWRHDMNTRRTWQYGLLVLALLLSSPASQAVSVFPNVNHFSVTLERRDVNEPDSEILGSGSFRLDLAVVDSAFTQFQEDVEFCLIHGSDPEHEDFCSMLPNFLVVEAPVLFGDFEMFGHTFTTEDFQWRYLWHPFTEEPLSLFIAFGGARWCDGGLCSEPQDPYLTWTSGLVMGYRVNGFSPLGDPMCELNDTCEGLVFGPAPALPEPGSLGLLSLGLAAFGFARRRLLV